MIQILDSEIRTNNAFVRVGYVDKYGSVMAVGTGFATRHPDDKPNKEVGLVLAYARAVEDLSKEIKKIANFEIGKADNYRRQELSKQRKADQDMFNNAIDRLTEKMLARFLRAV